MPKIENNRLSIIIKLLKDYDGKLPLRHFLKLFFKSHKKSGSTDRKIISNALYNYFRVCNTLKGCSLEQIVSIALFLSNTSTNHFIDYCITKILPIELSVINLPLNEKISILQNHFPEFNLLTIFPQTQYLSPLIDKVDFNKSFLTQPRVWIRIKSSFIGFVLNEIHSLNIDYSTYQDKQNILSFNPSVQLTFLHSFELGYFEVQDLSSILVSDYIDIKSNEYWWDVCAGSGGKSLSIIDRNPEIKLFLTDSRLTILKNLEERLYKAGFRNYTTSELDLSIPVIVEKAEFDGLILDVPCSGSGTWAREPENLSFFNPERIKYFSELQFNIVKNSIPYLKKNKFCYYITCSVFCKENEEQLERFKKELGLKVHFSKYITGYKDKADTIFISKMQKIR